MKRSLATAVFGLLAVGFAAWEYGSTTAMRAGQATIQGTTRGGIGITPGRSGRTIADATLMTDRGPVEATVRAWYCRFEPGQVVDVLYDPDRPADLLPDQFWQIHYASTIALVGFAVVLLTDRARTGVRG